MKQYDSTRCLSKHHEETVAKYLHIHRQSNSGATPFAKGDLADDDWLIECKTKMQPANSFTVPLDWLKKNDEERRQMQRMYSALAISFDQGENSYFIIDQKTFREMKEALDAQNKEE